MGSFAFLVDLCNPGYTKQFVTKDNTRWKVEEYWTFLNQEGSSTDVVDNLAHVIVVTQESNFDRAYSKTFEARPMEQTEFKTIEKSLAHPCYWFSVTFREYEEAFRSQKSDYFNKILCTLNFTLMPFPSDANLNYIPSKRSSLKKRYKYSSLKNISSASVKSITMKTVLSLLVQAIQDDKDEQIAQAMDFIAKNFRELKSTDLWADFTENHHNLTTHILGMLVDYMSEQNERASQVLVTAVSKRDIRQ